MSALEQSRALGAALRARGWTICAAESCTGGLLMSHLTDVSGSSDYINGGIVTYSNAAKQQFLHVSEQTLMDYGAVSEQTARAMAQGARALFQADLALSVTGIAGPGGGSPEKPVGLTYIGVAGPEGVAVARYVWQGDRLANKQASVVAALALALEQAQPSGGG